jgi:hypothetical protein
MTTATKIAQFTLSIEDSVLILKKNDVPCSCPFRNPTILPHPTIQGQMVINNPLCTSRCQFFDFDEKEDLVFTSCTNTPFTILIEKEKKSDNSRLQDSKILSL